jgi:hypothetical protein
MCNQTLQIFFFIRHVTKRCDSLMCPLDFYIYISPPLLISYFDNLFLQNFPLSFFTTQYLSDAQPTFVATASCLLARILRTMSATFSVDNRFFTPRYKPLFYLLFSLFPIFQPIFF